MIYWRIQDLYDAGICDAGREDCERIMAEEGVKPTDWKDAVWGLFGGVAGTLWGLGYVKKGCEAEARDALSRFIIQTARRVAEGSSIPVLAVLMKLDQRLQGHKFNLAVTSERLRMDSVNETLPLAHRAVATLLREALDEATPLHIRAVRVSEQAMLAATYHEGHAVPSTEAYKAEYQRQYDQLKSILEGNVP